MYGPAPPRPTKTNIVRKRTGCKTCRNRRKKCDEKKPACGTCKRLGISCEPVPLKLQFRNVSCNSIETQEKVISKSRDRTGNATLSPSEVDVFIGSSSCVSLPQQLSKHSLRVSDDEGDTLDERGQNEDGTSVAVSTLNLVFNLDADAPDYNNRALISLRSSILPHHDPVESARFYLHAWKMQCVPALPSAFHQLEGLRGRSLLVDDIMTALSACRLSRSMPQRKLIAPSSSHSCRFRPDADHESFSYQHYGSVMRQIARWKNEDFNTDAILGLTLLVLFCYLSASMGAFAEYRLHSQAATKLIQNHTDCVVRHGTRLLAALVEVEMQYWWRRAYFSRPNFHLHHGSLAISPQLELALSTAGEARAIVSLIMTESHRINMEAIVSCWNCESKGNVATYSSLLEIESSKLDNWFASLPECELPESWRLEQAVEQMAQGQLIIKPLRFRNHNAAMNFAYYVVARAMQCKAPLETLEYYPTPSHLVTAYEEAESWSLILLRIAAGLDWKEAVQKNAFTVGIVGLLIAATLRSHSLAIGVWVENWLEERLAGNEFEEGNFPVFQALEIFRLINRERRIGWDLLAIFQTVDDGGGTGKCGSYHSQLITSLWIYGRCQRTGRLSSYRCDI